MTDLRNCDPLQFSVSSSLQLLRQTQSFAMSPTRQQVSARDEKEHYTASVLSIRAPHERNLNPARVRFTHALTM